VVPAGVGESGLDPRTHGWLVTEVSVSAGVRFGVSPDFSEDMSADDDI